MAPDSEHSCSRSVPQPIDSMWSNNPVRMRLPPGGVPASYPQIKLPVLDNPALFEKLDTEALFFAFYYMPGTHQQYLAARELKRQSWRYHKQHGAWFQVGLASAVIIWAAVAACTISLSSALQQIGKAVDSLLTACCQTLQNLHQFCIVCRGCFGCAIMVRISLAMFIRGSCKLFKSYL